MGLHAGRDGRGDADCRHHGRGALRRAGVVRWLGADRPGKLARAVLNLCGRASHRAVCDLGCGLINAQP